jgi:ribonuclease HII
MGEASGGAFKIYAGIDEAGYGPLLGPLVIVCTVFQVNRNTAELVQAGQRENRNGAGAERHASAAVDPAPNLWEVLRDVVCRTPKEDRKRIAVNDSKILYQSGRGLKQLEKGVLAFLYSCGIAAGNSSELLTSLALDAQSAESDLPWYQNETGAPNLPLHWSSEEIRELGSRILVAYRTAKIQLVDVKAAVVFADRLNALLAETGSKASSAWCFIARYLSRLWEEFGRQHPLVVVDRQGGRKNYRDALASLFPACRFTVPQESSACSRYLMRKAERGMDLLFQVNSEQAHLPAALSSMIAKYIRELLMMRFQGYWRLHAPDVKPTCGYVTDGRRFLRQIEPLIDELGIDRRTLVRDR